MQEFGSKYEAETLRNSKKTELVDVILYIYDSSDTNSFSYISNLRQQYSLDHIPTLFVATKSDLDLAQQRHEVQPDVYCRRLFLQVPVAVSVKTAQIADVFATICRVAMNPYVKFPHFLRPTGTHNFDRTTSLPGGPERSLFANHGMRSLATLTVLLGSLGAGFMLVYRTALLRSLHGTGVGLFTSLAAWWVNFSGRV